METNYIIHSSEPRMVYMLGYVYYVLGEENMRQELILETYVKLHEQVRFSYLNDIPIKRRLVNS